MKSLLLALFASCIAIVSNAQIPAGTKLIGGNFNFGHQKQKYNSGENASTFFSINPTFGKAVKDNFVKGFSLSYGYDKIKSSNSSSYSNHSVGFGIFRQKFLPIGNSFMAFGDGNIGATYNLRSSNYKAYNISAGLGAGIAYNANNRLLLTLSLPNAINAYMNYAKETSPNLAKTTSFSTGINTRVSFQTFQFGILLMRK